MKKIVTTSALLILSLGFSKLVLADEVPGSPSGTAPVTSAPAPDESEKKAQEEKVRQEEAKKAEEEKQQLEAKKAEEERKAQEASRAAEEQRKAQEASQAAEEQRKTQEASQAAEVQRKAHEASLAAEAERKAQDAKNAEELKRVQNERKAEEDRKAQLNEQLARSAQAKEKASKRALHAQQPVQVSPTPSERMTARERRHMERTLHQQPTQAASAAYQETVVTQTRVENKESRPANSFTEKLKTVTDEVRSSRETRPVRPLGVIQPAHPVVRPAPVIIVKDHNDIQRLRERELKERELRLREMELRNREQQARSAPVITIVKDHNDIQRLRERELKERELRLHELELRNREQQVRSARVITIVKDHNDVQRLRERELKERELRLRELELRNREQQVRSAPVVTIVKDSYDVQRYRERELKERELRLRELELRNREKRLSEKEKVFQECEWYQRSLRNRYWQDVATRDQELRYLMWRERQLNTFTWIDQGRVCKYVTYYNKGVRVNKAVTITRWKNGVRTTYHPTRYYIYPVTRVVCYLPRRATVTAIVH